MRKEIKIDEALVVEYLRSPEYAMTKIAVLCKTNSSKVSAINKKYGIRDKEFVLNMKRKKYFKSKLTKVARIKELLRQNKTYKEIKELLNVDSTTISHAKQNMIKEDGGL